MEMLDMRGRSIELLRAYGNTRFPMTTFVPLALCLGAAAGLSSAATATWPQVGLRSVLAFLFLLQFRLWDDLEDRDRDRIRHPGRVLCQTQSLHPFQVGLAGLFLINFSALSAIVGGHFRLAIFLLLHFGLLGWYRIKRNRLSSPFLHAAVLMAKYPLFVFVLGDLKGDVGTWLAMGMVYGCALAYEAWHDPAFGVLLARRLLLAAVMVTLFFGLFQLITFSLGRQPL